MRKINQFIFFVLIGFGLSFAQFSTKSNIVRINIYKSFDKVHPRSQLKLAVAADIDSSFHINSNKPHEDFLIATQIKINSDTFKVIKIEYPKAQDIKLSFSEKPVSVYQGKVLFGVLIQVPDSLEPGSYKIPVEMTYQACNDQSCLPPANLKSEVEILVVNNKTQINEINADIFSKLNLSYQNSPSNVAFSTAQKGSVSEVLESSGIILSLLIVFIGGLALNLTPCVYPLVPITIGYFGGQSEGKTKRLILLGLLYVLGMALTYSVIGVVTALSGAVFGTLLQNTFVLIGIALVLVVLSLSMFGVYEFKLPDKWVAKAGNAKAGTFGAFFMGLTMGIVAAPCIGPFILGLVTYVASRGDVFYGFLLFFVMALGLGLPYLFLAIFSGKIKKLPRAGDWMEAVKHIFGFLLLGMAIYFIAPIFPKAFNSYLLPAFMFFAAFWLLFIDKMANNVKGFRIFKIIFSIVIMLISVYAMLPSSKNEPEWVKFSNEKYSQAINQKQKIILDFYADWCIPCKELDASTFSDSRVIKESSSFKMFKVDMTKTASEETESLRKQFNIIGMPTVIFINSNGEEVKRLTGFVNADEFLSIMKQVN
ncbi:protein-disulfide reductase DsbD [Melioribacteraceae bacterium 4301-Me]|uniref:protein-disulfide reductase DsbD family protein n=1 Tax=Pyranulibacter aquaticus TaxID=3163344 RepID=UPI0035950835